jgi:hypothetical protein
MFGRRLADIRHDRLLRDDCGSQTRHGDWQGRRSNNRKRRRLGAGKRGRSRTGRWWWRSSGIDRFDRDAREISVKRGLQSADPFHQGRMRRKTKERTPEPVCEKQMTRFLSARGFEFRAFGRTADLLKRARETAGVSRELHRRRVGQKLTLTADGGLDQPPEQNADPADDNKRETEQRQRILFPARVKENAADNGQA